ncbi:PAS domain S-box protein [Cypionkella sinensis]|uniref:histidine kinase n=1 Tax=Cypionkella sinensis TaxID=1756043 RepID=A0ABV7J3A9_9RHOB
MNIPETLAAQTIASEHYWEMLEAVSSGIFYWCVREDRVQWSPKLHKTLGYTAQEAAGVSDTFALLHPDDLAPYKQILGAAMAEARDFTASVRLKNAQGAYQHFDVSAHWMPTKEAYRPDLIGFLRDVTDLTETKAKAHRSEKIFHALCENMPAAVFIKGLNGAYIYGNELAAAYAGCTKDTFIGRSAPDIFGAETAMALQAVDERLIANGGSISRQDIFETEGGVRRSMLDTTFLIDGLSDGEKLIAGVVFDTTKQHEAEQALARSQRLEALGQLVGGIAHDFNNTLAVLKGNLELLQIIDDKSEGQLFCKEMEDAIERGRRLTLQLLAYGRKAILSPQVHNLSDILTSSDRMLRRVLPETIQIEMVAWGGLWNTMIDRSQVENAILNLAINARDSMPDGGKLTLETRNIRLDEDYINDRNELVTPGRYVMLAVTDTGSGMTREVVDRAFEPFFTTKSVGQGSGMGLAMVHGLMSQIGGSARIYSELGVGTTVKLYFKATEETANLERAVSPKSFTRGIAHVLLAEDEKSVRDMLTRQLQSLGYKVTVAVNGDQAYEILLGDVSIELLVTDVVMPGTLQGPMLAKRARENRPDLPVLFMSGYPREAAIHGNGLKEQDINLMKPVSMHDFAAAVAKLLDLRRNEI